MYGVLQLEEKVSIEVMGIKKELSLSWYKGQIGAMPVFKTREDALDYTNGDETRIFKIGLVE